MDIRDFAKKLGLDTNKGEFKDGILVFNLKSSDEYSRVYTLLEESKIIKIDQEITVMTPEESTLVYYNDDFEVKLIGDLKDDKYRLEIEEAKK